MIPSPDPCQDCARRPGTTRRAVLIGGVALTAAACATYGDKPCDPAPAPRAPQDTGADETTGNVDDGGGGGSDDGGGAAANAVAKTSDVPVGGGIIVGDTVLTQPTSGRFVALSTTCTHAGCKVSQVSGGTINCPCHGSKFGLDGSVKQGPASSPLESKSVRAEGDSLVLG